MPKPIDAAISQIEKQFGKGTIMRFGDKPVSDVPAISTGCLALDVALGIGGFPRGRISELYGEPSAGKSTIALSTVAEAQKVGGLAAYIDIEHALDVEYSRRLGVDVDQMLISQPDFGEQALNIAGALIESREVDVIVVDSVAALVPKAELDGEIGDVMMGKQARMMSQAMRKLTGIVAKSNTCLIFINQTRENIGQTYGNPATTTGGKALKFYASVRVELHRGAVLKDDSGSFGTRPKAKIVKNKMAPPFREAEFDLIFGEGISKDADVLDVAVAQGIVEQSGSWYSFAGEKIGNGRAKAVAYLSANQGIIQSIGDQVRQAIRVKPSREQVN